MDYEITVGKKVGSKLLYTSDKHLFIRKSSGQIAYYNCYIKDCKARLKIDQSKQCSYISGASTHFHGDQELTYQRFQVEDTMKSRCTNEKKNPMDVFNEECARNQKATKNMQFAKRHSTLKLHQRKGIPKNPKTLDDVKAYFENEDIIQKVGRTLNIQDPKMFYIETVITPDFAYVVFSSEAILTDLPPVRTIKIDSTFKCVPKGPFNQMFILSTDFENHSFPGLYVLMTRKTQVAYCHLLKYIEERWKINPAKAMTDYEKAIKNALRKQYPEIQLLSCWFHFCQALQRKAKKKKGFLKWMHNDDNARKLYRKFMCLPLMRSDSIPQSFKLLKDEAININKTKFTPFVNYMAQQWLQREGPEAISVFKEPERTNNPMESFNSTLGSKIPSNGCLYKFINLLRAEELAKAHDYNIIRNGGSQVYHAQRKEYREKNEQIFTIQHQFEKGNLNITQFFDKADEMYESDLVVEDEESDKEESDGDESGDDGDPINKLCEVCNIRAKTTMLLLCRHLKFCKECVESLLEEHLNADGMPFAPKCPLCETVVADHVDAFI